ncbi:hypothetical protein [Brevibacillus laterosporus]|uniref:Uncharacterized protein n=1 Tax=Brevibacillus laterosporus TaxID=1465 RepID=A0AAP8QGW0_BRELA|nr:hypothetical protein [Brevibacillus laterosporus]PPB12850.1 hypothetical protein C4A77_00250 [Brevibacillus laterosporus]
MEIEKIVLLTLSIISNVITIAVVSYNKSTARYNTIKARQEAKKALWDAKKAEIDYRLARQNSTQQNEKASRKGKHK